MAKRDQTSWLEGRLKTTGLQSCSSKRLWTLLCISQAMKVNHAKCTTCKHRLMDKAPITQIRALIKSTTTAKPQIMSSTTTQRCKGVTASTLLNTTKSTMPPVDPCKTSPRTTTFSWAISHNLAIVSFWESIKQIQLPCTQRIIPRLISTLQTSIKIESCIPHPSTELQVAFSLRLSTMAPMKISTTQCHPNVRCITRFQRLLICSLVESIYNHLFNLRKTMTTSIRDYSTSMTASKNVTQNTSSNQKPPSLSCKNKLRKLPQKKANS